MSAPTLRFLADESCDFAIVRALRAAGYDVHAVSEVMQRSDDRELIDQAHREGRILLTEDKDFGWLVYGSHVDSAGVILVRFPGRARRTLVQAIMQVVQEQGERLCRSSARLYPGQSETRHGHVEHVSREFAGTNGCWAPPTLQSCVSRPGASGTARSHRTYAGA